MSTIRLISKPRKKNDLVTIAIKVTLNNRDRAEKALFSIDPKYYNSKTNRVSEKHENFNFYNIILKDEINKANNILRQYEVTGKPFEAKDIFQEYRNKNKIAECINDYCQLIKFKNKRKYLNLLSYLDLYDPELMIEDIDYEFMVKFKNFLSEQPRLKSKETINRYLKFLKTILNNERRKDNYNNYQVLEFKTPIGSGNKAKLTKEEFEKIKEITIPDLQVVKDIFCLQVYLRGCRVGDVLMMKPENFINDHLIYTEQKTKKIQNIKLIPEALEIVKKYLGSSNFYIFPVLNRKPENPDFDVKYQKHIESNVSMLNRKLKLIAAHAGIEKKITTHVARHTFTSWADRSGVSSRQIQQMLNHSSLSVTENYLEGLRKSDELDEAAGRVFDF